MADQPAALASGAPARLGITVSRRVGPAVVRSRVKRRIREWFRRQQTSVPGGKDVVVIARASAARTSPVDAARDLDAALRQLSRSKGTA
jgi:ribonuclease P protein component